MSSLGMLQSHVCTHIVIETGVLKDLKLRCSMWNHYELDLTLTPDLENFLILATCVMNISGKFNQNSPVNTEISHLQKSHQTPNDL